MARKIEGMGITDMGFCKIGSEGPDGWFTNHPEDDVPEQYTTGKTSNMWGGVKGLFDEDTFPIAGCIPSLANIGSKTPKMVPPLGEVAPFLPGMLVALGAMVAVGVVANQADGNLEQKEEE